MSKTFEESWATNTVKKFWKRFAALATDSLAKYRSDPFFRTEVHIVGLQITFALVILGFVGVLFGLLYQNISSAILQGIEASATAHTPQALAPAIVEKIEHIKIQNLTIIASGVVFITILFGYIIARITLAPTRNALVSQKQFIGNVAHELRSPLSVIKTNTEIALLDTEVSRDMRDTLTSNIEELDRVSGIINNLLSLSALVRPERMEFGAVDLTSIARRMVETYETLARKNQVTVTVKNNAAVFVWGNETALRQITENLVKNAISYTPRGGTVEVTTALAPNQRVELIVQDSGIGIARKDLYRIFEPFYRSDPSRVRKQGGSGLGLTIVSELVKIHRGKITVRSAIGRGTTVTILLPTMQQPSSMSQIKDPEGLDEIAVDFSRRTF